ncbi:G-alpha-domain-containing protein [Athelia psychrophila]|uniref:G-alpha-domain-containing protein n=1 Tax=Athelia psychrophila TaxID=1759441 RepID=A0A166EMM9_9AGAM|nr:G-alpha-domain-containing protein [Fibularhizoctonia sp. CBS 109695]
MPATLSPRPVLSALSRSDDPLTRAMAPPENESPVDRETRLTTERQAKARSDAIDEELKRAQRKGPKPVKIMLLGQSESGKTTTLKMFQAFRAKPHECQAFHAERASWRAVVQYNVVRSIRIIVEAITAAEAAASLKAPFPSQTKYSAYAPKVQPIEPPTPPSEYPPLTEEHLLLKMRLSPLSQVEASLVRQLTLSVPSDYDAPSSSKEPKGPEKEMYVSSSGQWKHIFSKLVNDTRNSFESQDIIDWNNPNDPGVILHACADDMKKLWQDPIIQQLLRVQKLRIEEVAGFFLDSLDRVTAPRYVPSDDDILRARLKTLGVTEYRFTPETSGGFLSSPSTEWCIYDVGGQRSLVTAWAPFFDDINAVIFLAAISCFDQSLAEDESINRLEDSVQLWKSIIQNPLLKNANLVLFLNKCDVLKAKLQSGIRLADYVMSYGNRPNDFASASKYLKKKFSGIHRDFSVEARPLYCHFTQVIDTKSTTLILHSVQDMLLRGNLKKSSLTI